MPKNEPYPFDTLQIAHLSGKRYLATLIEMYVADWLTRGQFAMPDLRDAIDFLVTEVGELVEARLRQNTAYVRNNDRQSDLAAELADVVFMAHITAQVAGVDIVAAVEDKLDEMDKKRLDDRGEA